MIKTDPILFNWKTKTFDAKPSQPGENFKQSQPTGKKKIQLTNHPSRTKHNKVKTARKKKAVPKQWKKKVQSIEGKETIPDGKKVIFPKDTKATSNKQQQKVWNLREYTEKGKQRKERNTYKKGIGYLEAKKASSLSPYFLLPILFNGLSLQNWEKSLFWNEARDWVWSLSAFKIQIPVLGFCLHPL